MESNKETTGRAFVRDLSNKMLQPRKYTASFYLI